MRVRVEMDRMGNITATAVNDRIRRKFVAHLKEVYSEHADGSAFFQEGGPSEEFLADCTPAQRRDINAGWSVNINVDPWMYGHWLGWDAHVVAENGV